MNSILPGHSSYFQTISLTLKNRASLCEFNGLVNRLCPNDDKTTDGFFHIAERSVCHNVMWPHHSRSIKGKIFAKDGGSTE